MKVKVNGIEKELSSSLNLKSAIEQFCRDTNRVIAEVNGEIVKSPLWETTPVQEGDSIELVTFVGGG